MTQTLSYSTITGTIEELLAINGLNIPKIRIKIEESKDNFSLIDNNRKFPNYFENKIGTSINLPVLQFHLKDSPLPKLLKVGDKVTLDVSVIEYEMQGTSKQVLPTSSKQVLGGKIKSVYTGYQI